MSDIEGGSGLSPSLSSQRDSTVHRAGICVASLLLTVTLITFLALEGAIWRSQGPLASRGLNQSLISFRRSPDSELQVHLADYQNSTLKQPESKGVIPATTLTRNHSVNKQTLGGTPPPQATKRSISTSLDPNKRYLFYGRTGDWCKGIGHHKYSLACMLAEALYLNRTLVFDMEMCLGEQHNGGKVAVKNIYLYYDVDKIASVVPIIPMTDFLRDWEDYNKKHMAKKIPDIQVDKHVPTKALRVTSRTVVWRVLGDDDYAYEICDDPRTLGIVQKPWGVLWGYAPPLMQIVWDICGAMKWNFAVVHVRRGDKLLDKKKWPNLDFDTQPQQLLKKLPQFVKPRARLYIATDERTKGFFDPLKEEYEVYTLDDFSHLWAKDSPWYKSSQEILKGKEEPEFDGYMQGMVDYKVIEKGKKVLETFNDLTKDPRHGF
eukprot:jgi/Mesen1/2630/ME000166S01748